MYKKRENRDGDTAQLIECLSHIHEALVPAPVPQKPGVGTNTCKVSTWEIDEEG